MSGVLHPVVARDRLHQGQVAVGDDHLLGGPADVGAQGVGVDGYLDVDGSISPPGRRPRRSAALGLLRVAALGPVSSGSSRVSSTRQMRMPSTSSDPGLEVAQPDLVAHPRAALQLLEHPAAQGGEALLGHVAVQAPPPGSRRGRAVDRVAAVACGLDQRGLEVELVLHLADELLHHVLDGDDAGRAAVLVHHDGERGAGALEALQRHLDVGRLGDEADGAQQAAQRGCRAAPGRGP